MSFGTTAAPAAVPADYKVPQSGTDGISSITWSPTSNLMVSSNWDSGVRCWEAQESGGQIQAIPKAQVNHEGQSPVLCTAFSPDGSTVFSGGGDKAVRMWKLGQQPNTPNAVPQQIGVHNSAVKSVGFLSSSQLVVSGGWDKQLKFWDARQPNPAGVIDLPGPVYDMDVKGNMMVVATAGRHLIIYDVTGQPREHLRAESPLKYQTRCVACFPDMSGYAVGSIEGRVGIQNNQETTKVKNFAFKCHRQTHNVFSVNALSFHPFGTFATVGADGVVSFWDKDNKQRLKVFPTINQTISCANFNAQGNMFAYGGSYDWGKGSSFYTPGTPNDILIHYTSEDDMKAKKKN